MQSPGRRWLSTEQIAERVGMTGEWVRRQIIAGRLRALVFRTGSRATYRISEADLRHFMAEWSVATDDPEWEGFDPGRPGPNDRRAA
jgi:excisionase family DNA binding protein